MSTAGQILTQDRIDERLAAVVRYTNARLSAQEIAGLLGVSQRTVVRYRARARQIRN